MGDVREIKTGNRSERDIEKEIGDIIKEAMPIEKTSVEGLKKEVIKTLKKSTKENPLTNFIDKSCVMLFFTDEFVDRVLARLTGQEKE